MFLLSCIFRDTNQINPSSLCLSIFLFQTAAERTINWTDRNGKLEGQTRPLLCLITLNLYKDKVSSPSNRPRRPRERDRERERVEVQLYSSFNLCARWGGWSTPRSDHFTPGKETRNSLYRRLAGPQGRSGRVRKISPTPRFDPRTVQQVASRYTDWAIPAHIRTRYIILLHTLCRNISWLRKNNLSSFWQNCENDWLRAEWVNLKGTVLQTLSFWIFRRLLSLSSISSLFLIREEKR